MQTDAIALTALEAVKSSDAALDTGTIGFVVMPDHVHWLFELGERLALGRVLARFKAATRRTLSAATLSWQRDFYEHRLRFEESVEDYALYIFLNPYRAIPRVQPGRNVWWSSVPERLQFLSRLNPDGSPPEEWLSQEPRHPLHVGE